MPPTDQAQAMPLFYREPRVLQPAAHGAVRVKPGGGYGFARDARAIPLAADEMIVAQAHYPIVFPAGGPPVPVAVTGLGDDGGNLFLDPAGEWRPGSYVPAYVRRFPFLFVRLPDRDQLQLGLDEASDRLSKTEGQPLFENGEPSAITLQAMKFCSEFQRQHGIAERFGQLVAEQDLLIEQRATFQLGSTSATVGGFRVIDEARFQAMPDGVFLEWRRQGWLALVYAQLMSMRQWERLAALAAAQLAKAA